MKTIIITLLCVMSLNAQNIKSDGTHFIDGVKDSKWSNSNGKDFTNASFSDFNGSCYVNLEVDRTTEVSFRSLSEVKKGRIEVTLLDENENKYFYCNTTDKCDLQKDIVLEKGKKYRLYFTGDHAKGKYVVNWKLKK
ncbi:hypothetical protein J2X31_000660 [Flavobacterium arsenatis]|uniref:Uncharacterized protein n=1 Tax=Flavobacterium arsenatis TaxID=1484332 RepID=A0ABU1TL05_9FLAO|nr:hypothetical protein [Flavobacterium arsenatis]MDR6966662.1 hypothetical protein [Flavobacterium arsenatis]